MEHTRKWILSPTETDISSKTISDAEVKLILKMLSNNLINDEGKLLSKTKGEYISDSSIYENLSKKKDSRHFNRFLELKGQLTSEKAVKRPPSKKSKWDLDDD